MTDNLKQLYAAGDFTEFLQEAMGTLKVSLDLEEIAKKKLDTAKRNMLAALILQPNTGVHIEAKDGTATPRYKITFSEIAQNYSNHIRKWMENRYWPNYEEAKAQNCDKFDLLQSEVDTLELISGKPIAELAAKPKPQPNRPSRATAKPTAGDPTIP